jgi:hypothetical protein
MKNDLINKWELLTILYPLKASASGPKLPETGAVLFYEENSK